jgi:hypothetical protein
MLLPLIGWLALIPLQLAFPIYQDELEWNLINSRMLIDSGKLLYLFLPCSSGFLLDVPISWYPTRLMDAALYADMTNPQILRYWAILIFWAIILYSAWFARRTLCPNAGFLNVIGVVLAPLALAVLPFQLVMNRPEQGLVVAILLGCTIPVLLEGRRVNTVQAWGLAACYVLLSWTVAATHIKGLFFLPALLAAGTLAIRRWLPSIVLTAAAAFGVLETLKLWSRRTDCPESTFLIEVFRTLSIRPDDFANGVGQFIGLVGSNFMDAASYWTQVAFQQDYDSDWLPSAASQLTMPEIFSNAVLPTVLLLGLMICAAGVALEFKRTLTTGVLPRTGALIGFLLIFGIIGMAGFQVTKNFYEAGLLFPMLGLAVLLFLPGIVSQLPNSFHSGARAMIGGLVLCAVISQSALIWRFQDNAATWRNDIASRASRQDSVRNVVERCGIANNSTTSRLILDELSYTVLWRTREPVLERYLLGWYGTGLDRNKLIRDRNISGIVAKCETIPFDYNENVIAKDGYCCVKLSK